MHRRRCKLLVLLLVSASLGWAGCDSTDPPEEPENQAPAITSTAPAEVALYGTYSYAVLCVDPDENEEPVEVLNLGDDDSCGGDLTLDDASSGSGLYQFSTELFAPGTLGDSCDVVLTCTDGELTTTQSTTVTIAPPADIADLTFDALQPWATPVADYVEANTEILGHSLFQQGILELAVFDHRLYFGYGDATLNLGRNTPIELRSWESPVADAWRSEFATDEEQISLYRTGPEVLVVPGIDATEDGLLGNAYTLHQGGEWHKSRTLEGGLHVQDTAVMDGAIYACGSGGTWEDYDASAIRALLWRSDDGGTTFEPVIWRDHPAPPGDQRLTTLLPVSGELFASGYFSSPTGSFLQNFRLDGDELVEWTGMGDFSVLQSEPLDADRGLVAGVVVGATARRGMRVVTADGPEPAAATEGWAVLDLQGLGDGRALLLVVDGDEHPLAPRETWDFTVALTTDGHDSTELLSAAPGALPLSVAFWRGSIYVGFYSGEVWRARGR